MRLGLYMFIMATLVMSITLAAEDIASENLPHRPPSVTEMALPAQSGTSDADFSQETLHIQQLQDRLKLSPMTELIADQQSLAKTITTLVNNNEVPELFREASFFLLGNLESFLPDVCELSEGDVKHLRSHLHTIRTNPQFNNRLRHEAGIFSTVLAVQHKLPIDKSAISALTSALEHKNIDKRVRQVGSFHLALLRFNESVNDEVCIDQAAFTIFNTCRTSQNLHPSYGAFSEYAMGVMLTTRRVSSDILDSAQLLRGTVQNKWLSQNLRNDAAKYLSPLKKDKEKSALEKLFCCLRGCS